jgi:hypothetical protein
VKTENTLSDSKIRPETFEDIRLKQDERYPLRNIKRLSLMGAISTGD